MNKLLFAFLLFTTGVNAQLRETVKPDLSINKVVSFEEVNAWEISILTNDWEVSTDGLNSALALYEVGLDNEELYILVRSCDLEFEFFAFKKPINKDSLNIDSGYYFFETEIYFTGSAMANFSFSQKENEFLRCGNYVLDSIELREQIVFWENAFKGEGFKKHKRTFGLNYFSNGKGEIMFIAFLSKVNKSTGKYSHESCSKLNINGDWLEFDSKEVLKEFHTEINANDFITLFGFL